MGILAPPATVDYSRGVWHRDASATCCPLAAVIAADCGGGVWHQNASTTCCPHRPDPSALLSAFFLQPSSFLHNTL